MEIGESGVFSGQTEIRIHGCNNGRVWYLSVIDNDELPLCRLTRRPRHSTFILYRTGCIIGQSLIV
ncbi:hypothetical protein AG1IA_03995 [Rhizoctonia solani AG-1 IA]|uniref:Uncharacterized protein n=1 Tax=Thanatephorus cucumeris (strain AG1-IA) TaxID=983506 RepID=L8WV24_THACA|nr:hypothetical protein AG1IA_03995 [Rhizoctonia solani AG-1 IA]